MLVKTFIEEKNKILFKYTNMDLIPKDQIVNIDNPVEPLYFDESGNDAAICPYCLIYDNEVCIGCPMYEEDNKCDLDDEDSTYTITIDLLGKHYDTFSINTYDVPWAKKLKKLINKYNKELPDELDIRRQTSK